MPNTNTHTQLKYTRCDPATASSAPALKLFSSYFLLFSHFFLLRNTLDSLLFLRTSAVCHRRIHRNASNCTDTKLPPSPPPLIVYNSFIFVKQKSYCHFAVFILFYFLPPHFNPHQIGMKMEFFFFPVFRFCSPFYFPGLFNGRRSQPDDNNFILPIFYFMRRLSQPNS